MSAIEATTVGYRSLVDGTLRLTLDVEPNQALAALNLFAAPGVAVALARLAVEASRGLPEAVSKPKGGKLSQDAARICQSPEFQAFALSLNNGEFGKGEEGAACWMRWHCEIDSRSELDSNKAAAVLFRQLMQRFREWRDVSDAAP